MKKILFTACCTLCILMTKAQDVNYKILTDDTYGLKNASVCLDPFYADTWGTNVTLGFDVRADYMLINIASFNAEFRNAYLDMNARDHFDGSLPMAKNGLKKMKYLELGGAFNLVDKTRDASLKVVLSSTSYTVGNTRYTNTKYIMVPGQRRTILQVRGGLTTSTTAIDMGDEDEIAPNFKATAKGDTTSFVFGSFGEDVDGSAIYGGYTMMRMVNLHAGFSLKRITNLIISTDNYGNRSNASLNDLYLDVLFAPVVSFSDVKTVGGKEWDISNTDMKRLGWRAGWSTRSSSRSFLTYKFEFGSRPGFRGKKSLIGSNAFLFLSMGWSIPFRANLPIGNR